MCVTALNAKLSGSAIGGNVLENGNHALSYQFDVENTSGQPNGLILPIPGDVVKLHDTSTYPDYLLKIWDEVQAKDTSPKRSYGKSLTTIVVRVGQYLVLYGKDIEDIKAIILQQPIGYQAEIGEELSDFYKEHYAGENIVVCLFESTAEMSTQPFLVEYTPYNPEYFRFPMMDAHDGSAPQKELVERDHTILFGIENDKDADGKEAKVSIPYAPSFINKSSYIGAQFKKNTQNGDLFVRIAKNHKADKIFNEIQMAWNFEEALAAMKPLN